MGFLDSLFERKAATGGTAAVSRAISQSPSRHGMWGSTGNWDVDKAVAEAYEKDLWVFRCIDAIASNQAGIPILHRIGDSRTGRLKQSPKLMTLLNVRPNNYETAWQFRYRLSTQLNLSRKGAFIEIVGDPQNPDSLHLLPPQGVEPIPHPTKFVSGYKVKSADNQFSEITLKPSQVIWVKLKPHPIDPYQQMTPLIALGMSIETDILARMFNRNFLRNDGRPGLLVSVRGQINPDDAAELKRRFGGGPQQAGQVSVIEGEGMDVVDFGATPRDAQWSESIASSKEDILLGFGVPESVMGNASGRTFDNADAEYEMFWTHTMKKHCDGIAAAFDVFTGDVNDSEVIAYDYDTIDVLQRQERRRQDAIIDRWSRGVITWNEMRKAIGLTQWTEALAARIIVLPSGFAMAEDGDDQAKIMQLPNVQVGADPGQAMSDIAQQGARLGAAAGQRQLGNILAARALQLAGKSDQPDGDDADPFVREQDIVDAIIVHPYLAERKELEATLDGVLIGMSSRQESVVADRLAHTKSRKGTRHWEENGEVKAVPGLPSLKPLDPLYAVEIDRWARETRDDFQRVLTPVLRREARRVAADMARQNMDKPSVPDTQAIVEAMLADVLQLVEISVRNQSTRIADKITALDKDGKAIPEITKEVRNLVGTRSSWRKALTGQITTTALEGVKHDVYALGSRKMRKTWNTEDDEKVRDSHFHVDGKTLKMDELFWVGETMMAYPGQPGADIKEVAGCRCWLTFQVGK